MPFAVQDSYKFRQWEQRIKNNGCALKKVDILGYVSRNNKDLYSAFIDCSLLTPEGVEIPRCILITGDSVVIVPVLTCIEDEGVYTLMVEQLRISDGSYKIEFAAGGMEIESDPRIAACHEILEELDLIVCPEDLISLNTDPIHVVPSALEGRMYFFCFEKEVSLSFLEEMENRNAGCVEDNEYIRIKVCKMSEVVAANTPTALMGLKLLEHRTNQKY
jgi:hypothetical protein